MVVVVLLQRAVLRQLPSLVPPAPLPMLPLSWEVPVGGVKRLWLALVGFRPPPWSELQVLPVQALAVGSAVDGIPPLLRLGQPRSPVPPPPYRPI